MRAAAVRNVWQFYLLRFLLGLAEGGAHPLRALLLSPCLISSQASVPFQQLACYHVLSMLSCYQHTTLLPVHALDDWGFVALSLCITIAAGTFPGTFYHASLFFSTKELNLGFAAVTTATAISQARLS